VFRWHEEEGEGVQRKGAEGKSIGESATSYPPRLRHYGVVSIPCHELWNRAILCTFFRCSEDGVSRSMSKGTDQLGKRGEKIARKFLRRRGYRIRALNYSCPYGEIDIIAQDGKTIAFVEVRTLSSGKHGPPFDSVGREKRRRVTRAARDYLHKYKLAAHDWRFDFVGIILAEKGSPEVELIKDAFPPTR